MLYLAIVIFIAIIIYFLYLFISGPGKYARHVQKNPTPNAVAEFALQSWSKLNRGIFMPRHLGGRLTILPEELILMNNKSNEVLRSPLKQIRIDYITPEWGVRIYLNDETKQYAVKLWAGLNPSLGFKNYEALEKALVQVRGQGFSNNKTG